MSRIFFYSLFSNKARIPFWGYIVFSSFINFLFLYFLLVFFKSEQEKIYQIQNSQKNILVDLELIKDDLIHQKTELINDKSKRGAGKISDKKEQHIVGGKVPQQVKKVVKTKKVKKTENKKNNQQAKVSPMQFGIETKNQLQDSFYVDDSHRLTLSIRSHEDANFLADLKKILSKQFNQFMQANLSSLVNYRVQKDEVVVLASINRNGEIFFVDTISESKKQPYLNYLAKKLVSSPGILKILPSKLKKNQQKEYVQMYLKISTTGQPLYQWWISIDFDS